MKGLRREEVALLAGVSPEYYVRLERGQATGPSSGVVDAVADVLRLDGDERAHLDRLLAALTPEARKRSRVAAKDPVTPGVRVLLDALDHLPAVVFNGRLDLLAGNALGGRSTPRCTTCPGDPTARVSCSSTSPAPDTCSPNGTGSQVTPSRCCAPRPGATPTTPS